MTTWILMVLLIASMTPADARSNSGKSPELPIQTRRKTKVDVKYDKKKDLSTVRLEEIVLWENPVGFEQVTMGVKFDYPKRIIATPKSVSIRFSSVTDNRSPFLGETLFAFVDDVRLDLGKLNEIEKRNLGPTPGKYLSDRVTSSIPYEDFAKMAKAKSLRLVVADKDYSLTAPQLQMLRDFLELMQMEGQEFR